mmetsp:Transcript_9307/g.12664  ORF Transcript_9307/g.12664 Transcript_9307/m.12664 type:complete len:101 (-) Transcript_9307:1248-1550(-)
MKSRKCTVSTEELEVEVNKRSGRKRTRPVKVRMINMEWFYREKNSFSEFSRLLKKLPDEAYSSELVNCVLDQFWKPTKKKIVLNSVLPNVCLMLLTIAVL